MTHPKRRVLSHFPRDGIRWIEDDFPEIEIVAIPAEGPLEENLEGEILLTYAFGSPNIQDVLPRGIRWVHTIGAGIDGFPLEGLGDRIFTCSRGVSSVPIAEWTLAVMLAFEKQLPEMWITAPPERWNWAQLGSLAGRNLSILGLGGIGQAIATRALAFGMHVKGIRRTQEPCPVKGVNLAEDLSQLVYDADHLVIAAPATTKTKHIIGEKTLAQGKPRLHLVNVARGDLVDQEALRTALDDGRVARASLDVATPEPLPEGHWLYHHPRVRLSPHVSWSMPNAVDHLVESFVHNLRLYLDKKPLKGLVSIEHGY